MTPEELAKMRDPLNHKNIDRIRKLRGKIELSIELHSRNMSEVRDWFREIADELCGCRAILIEEYRRRPGHDGGEREYQKKIRNKMRRRK